MEYPQNKREVSAMREPEQLDNSRLESLLKLTAQRLGSTPEALKDAAQNGSLSQLLGQRPEGEAMQKVLSDPEAAKKLLSSPQSQALLNMLQGKG
jgi:hypothetical protein